MYNYEWDRLKTWLSQYDAIDESILSPEDIIRLDLSSNSLKVIPDNFGILTKLLVLNLSNNNLESLPESMEKLSNLSNLDIRRNSFKKIPNVISKLNLRSFNMSGNSISDISIIKECTGLRVLDASSNLLKEVQDCFALDNELITLNLSTNYIKDVENLFIKLKNVERLNLSGNLLYEIPSSIYHLENIIELEMVDNNIEKINEEFFNLDVQRVDLTSNQISNINLHLLESLEEITLDENHFSIVNIDDNFAPYLKKISCDSCMLKEFLFPPSKLLEVICYSSNYITTIPDNIDRYINLKELDIDGNNISKLPDALANLVYLQTFYAKDNPLNDDSKKVVSVLSPNICDLNMKSGIVIEEAIDDDLEQMANLISVLFTIEKDFNIDFNKQFAGVQRLFRDDGTDLLVAKHDNSVVGMITMQRLISSAEGDYIGQIEDLVVHQEYRKMGVGSRLINKMRTIAQEHGYKRIQLAADVDNINAHHFYNRRGFKKTNLNIFHYSVS